MSSTYSRSISVSRRRPLAACVAALFGLSTPAAMAANTWFINTCNAGVSNTDSTHGSLRWALDPSRAQSGDTIDMTAIGCSTISLHTGALTGTFAVPQNDLTILGPGMANLTITGLYSHNSMKYYLKDRIFNHSGTGKLSLYDLSVEKGYYKNSSGTAEGGCIYSNGGLYLKNVQVFSCTAATDSGSARGGAIAAHGLVQLKYSTVSVSSANSGATGVSIGGGVYTTGDFASTAATIKYNQATGPTLTHAGYAGGLDVRGSTTMFQSTISGNTATRRSGGAEFFSFFGSASNSVFLGASTVSGNTSEVYAGGIYSNAGSMSLWSSTVAFNTSVSGHKGSKYYAPGLATSAFFSSVYIELRNSLISNNTYGSLESDLSLYNNGSNTTTFNSGPAYNLVRVPTTPTVTSNLPSDTIKFTCPLLGPLRDNGGLTHTHALNSGSVAIDSGTNPFGFLFSYDQRGAPYLRPDVKSGISDIGAYEVQQDDIVFTSGVDGCPT
jgi:hypothetical protein